MGQGYLLTSLKFIFIDLIGEVLYFPIWWYTSGAKKAFLFFMRQIWSMEMTWGVRVWVTNLFRPMYGLHDWQSQIISFFMRLFQIIFRAILLLVWSILMFALFLIWLFLPLFVAYQIFINFIY